jgi:CheY-like chemotaxis protein
VKSQRHTILVIDDDANDRFLIERALHRIDPACTVQMAKSGSEAVAYLRGAHQYADRRKFQFPGYIITDLKMPDGDGLEVLSFLKQNPSLSVIPVVVLSSSSDEDDIRQAYALGASGYLVKPQATQELVRRLKLLYDFFGECEVPQVTASGHEVPTSSEGKIGQRFERTKSDPASQIARSKVGDGTKNP